MAVCLATSLATAAVAANAFTLAWTHSIERVRWEEDWRVEGQQLQIVAARVKGSGAGMEPPPEARKQGRFWVWSPLLRVPEVRLAQSGMAGEWALCPARDTCFQPSEASRLLACPD